jgi:hypothetical protein
MFEKFIEDFLKFAAENRSGCVSLIVRLSKYFHSSQIHLWRSRIVCVDKVKLESSSMLGVLRFAGFVAASEFRYLQIASRVQSAF